MDPANALLEDFEYRAVDPDTGSHLARGTDLPALRRAWPQALFVQVHRQHPWRTALKTENPHNAANALTAFRTKYRTRTGWSVHFEHGQLWITGTNGANYSVVDAEGPGSVDGFDFEMITAPDED